MNDRGPSTGGSDEEYCYSGGSEEDYELNDEPGWEQEITKPEIKKPSNSTPQPAPSAVGDLEAFRMSWQKELKGDKDEPKKNTARERSLSPLLDYSFFPRPSYRRPSPPRPANPAASAAQQEQEQQRIADARARLRAPRALLKLLSSPSAARAFLTHPAFSRADLGRLRRVCSPFSAPIQRIIFTKLVVKTTSQLASLAALPEDLITEVGSITFALGDLEATARDVPLVRAMMESISSAVEDVEPSQAGDDLDSLYGPTEEELAVRRRQAAFDLAVTGLDRSDLFELRGAIRAAYSDAPFQATRVGDTIELDHFTPLHNSALAKLNDVQIAFPASSLAGDLLSSLSRQLVSLEIICPRRTSQILPSPIDLRLDCPPCNLFLAPAGVTALAHIPPTLTTLTLEGVTLVPHPNLIEPFRASPYDLQELSLTRIAYRSDSALDGDDGWGRELPRLVRDDRSDYGEEELSTPSVPATAAVSALTSGSASPRDLGASTAGALVGAGKSAWGGYYEDFESVSDHYSMDKLGYRLPGRLVHDERPFELNGGRGTGGAGSSKDKEKGKGKAVDREATVLSSSTPLDLHLFTGAGQDVLRILRLDSVGSTFTPDSIALTIKSNSKSLEEIVVVEDAVSQSGQGLFGGKASPRLKETVFATEDDLYEESSGVERTGSEQGIGYAQQELDADLVRGLQELHLSPGIAPPLPTPASTDSLSPFAKALSLCTELNHLRLSNRTESPSTYPLDIIDGLLLSHPSLSLLELRLAAPKLEAEAMKMWQSAWEPKVRGLLRMVEEGGFARVVLVEEIA